MKATKQMIDAACESAPNVQRHQVSEMVQAALDAQETEASPPLRRTILGAMVFSGFVTGIFLLASLFASGTWLDPRVWSGSYVPGDTLASSMDNGAWLIDAATSAAPGVFLGLWGLLVALLLIAKKFTKT